MAQLYVTNHLNRFAIINFFLFVIDVWSIYIIETICRFLSSLSSNVQYCIFHIPISVSSNYDSSDEHPLLHMFKSSLFSSDIFPPFLPPFFVNTRKTNKNFPFPPNSVNTFVSISSNKKYFFLPKYINVRRYRISHFYSSPKNKNKNPNIPKIPKQKNKLIFLVRSRCLPGYALSLSCPETIVKTEWDSSSASTLHLPSFTVFSHVMTV